MSIIYLGNRIEQAPLLQQAFSRISVSVVATSTPEQAFFKILHGQVVALFLDVAHLDRDPGEVISNLAALERDIEIVLIGTRDALFDFPKDALSMCFGAVSDVNQHPLDELVFRQLTDKLSLKNRLETLKSTSIADGLTLLYNHAFIQGQLEEEVRMLKESGEPLSLVMLDLDNFKNYNDTNGHPAGDQVLRQSAQILENTIRKFDFAARYGGEEFALVLPCCKLLPALRVAERVRQAIASYPYEHREKQPLGLVSASLGVATMDHKDITTKADLLEKADQALYRAKGDGRNRVWFYRDGAFHHYHGKNSMAEPSTV